eukprot:Nitzschia sp. Nitz4//scaffold71_size96697//33752//34930//NITZ4_004691-RA/size96697-processed-gene-0.32-mRNA-1//-1//CDS//3329557235//2156//frame0
MQIPWSKKHKQDFQHGKVPIQFNLSNSFAEPLSQSELEQRTKERGDLQLLHQYQHDHSLEYTPNGGSQDLKEEIAKLYGNNITPDHILVFPGAQVAIQTAAQAFCSEGHAIVFVPGYQSTIESPEWVPGCTGVTQIPRSPANDWQMDLDLVRAAIREDTKYLVMNEPFNPGGIVMNKSLQKDLVELCDEHGIVILSDEVYRLLEHDPSDRIPAMAEVYDKGISCVTMSKPWGACGITIGWLACPNLDMMQRLWNCQYFGTACMGRATELQAMMILRASEDILKDRMAIIRHNKKLLQEVVEERYPDLLEWSRPNAGAIAFLKFKGPLTSQELGQLLQSKGISMKPSYCFMETTVPNLDYFRVGFGERKMPIALDAFVAVMEAHKDEWRRAMH